MKSKSDSTSILTVDLGDRSYPIHIGSRLIEQSSNLISPLLRQPGTFIVTDENVAPYYLEPLQSALASSDVKSEALVLPAGETTKNFENLEKVVSTFLSNNIERSTTVIALGGGVIGDLTGFAASVVLRGINFIQIPTTLLAQVDSSVGGKTGINTAHGKNLVGSFHQPIAVITDIDTLKTLQARELRAGYAEICKYGLLGDAAFWQWLEDNGADVLAGDPQALSYAIHTSCVTKARIVAEDERESGVRALLNLGHTFAHALEAELGYTGHLLHGEAVAIGMVMAFELSARLGLCPVDDPQRVRTHLEAMGLTTSPPKDPGLLDVNVLMNHMTHDKKVKSGKLAFVLVRGIGQAFLTQDVSVADVMSVIEDTLTA